MQRPSTHEYHQYYETYVGKVPNGDIFQILERQLEATESLLRGVPAELETHAYAEGKWSVREVLGHMLDTERLFGFRTLWIARGDQQEQPGMDQDNWGALSNAKVRPLTDLVEEFSLVRRGHLLMFRGLTDDDWMRTGTASGFRFTARAFPFIMAGHEIHHRQVLADRYLVAN